MLLTMNNAKPLIGLLVCGIFVNLQQELRICVDKI